MKIQRENKVFKFSKETNEYFQFNFQKQKNSQNQVYLGIEIFV